MIIKTGKYLHDARRTSKNALLLFLSLFIVAAFSCSCFADSKYTGPPAEPYKLGGLSFTTAKNLDVLRMSAPVNLIPEVYRHAIPQRIVMRFDNTVPLESLLSLLSGKRGDCVEKIEVQRLRNYAEGAGVGEGVRKFSEYSTLVVAYVPSDVDARVTTDAGVIEIVFQRVHDEPSRPYPLPITSLVDVSFESTDNKEIITFFFNEPVTPSVYEETAPHRLILMFPSTDIDVKAVNRFRRFMQTPLLFHVEGFNIGSMPQAYPEIDESRDYHFSIYPSPLADDVYGDKIFGKQTRDALITLYPLADVTFTMPQTEKNIVKVVFEKHVPPQEPMVCTKFEPAHTEPAQLYSVEDEYGVKVGGEEK